MPGYKEFGIIGLKNRIMNEFIELDLNGNPEIATMTRAYHSIRRMLPDEFSDINVWFGGGCYVSKLSQQKIADIDIFSSHRDQLHKALVALRKNGYKMYFSNKNAIKGYITHPKYGRVNIDVVKMLFPDEIETIQQFDFSVVKIVTNPSTEKCYYYQSSPFDIMQKRLVIPHKLPHPMGTLKRMQKYIKKGFTACDGTMVTLSRELAKIDFSDPQQNIIEFYPDGRKAVPMWD